MKNSSFLKKVTISENSSIKDAYEKITSTGINCLCVTNNKNLPELFLMAISERPY